MNALKLRASLRFKSTLSHLMKPFCSMEKVPSDLQYKTESSCLRLCDDEAGSKIEVVSFTRDEDGEGDIDAAAARVLGIPGDNVRCFSLPGSFDKRMDLAMHMYIDLQGLEKNLPHNTNASQLWLCANLPEEPPEVTPSTISGPVLITADHLRTEEFVDLTIEDWIKIKKLCKEICPNALFV
ncbi:hypothetical protein CEUSTIGMA_g12997.t1 [Chlamydomonas eustigma]|uniref:Uncharacterized protein n=1 Tax=Chlamydomonas eustigma TaxID=1157962 RepID=A0A250XRM4_9CHLO|nr:hypothetical protein CEUSTIGMA_g12997.t1 [Chlamydomonas eustigma]|eukprot:GAX85582.1 hypothetical protein CEUSTIGMA_g12997.t1 [Chlamydomonas eustigma]